MGHASHSDAIIGALQANAETLLRERWVEAWGYFQGEGKTLSLTLKHTIAPDNTGAYRLKTSIGFGVRLNYSVDQTADLGSAAQPREQREPVSPFRLGKAA